MSEDVLRSSPSDTDEESFLRQCWDSGLCPCCKRSFPASQRIGSGKRAEGGFCSLNCYAEYYKDELATRLRRFAQP